MPKSQRSLQLFYSQDSIEFRILVVVAPWKKERVIAFQRRRSPNLGLITDNCRCVLTCGIRLEAVTPTASSPQRHLHSTSQKVPLSWPARVAWHSSGLLHGRAGAEGDVGDDPLPGGQHAEAPHVAHHPRHFRVAVDHLARLRVLVALVHLTGCGANLEGRGRLGGLEIWKFWVGWKRSAGCPSPTQSPG